jgi:ankyrin repeat protein
MTTLSLPDRPNLAQLRRQAKELRDAARADDPAAAERISRHLPVPPRTPVALSIAQLVLAREYGFPSWPAMKAEVEARTMTLEQRVAAFLHASIEGRTGAASRLLESDQRIAGHDISTAATMGDIEHVREVVERDPSRATAPDGRRGWPPLLYVCHSRWHQIDPRRGEGMLAVARLLLDAGADPNTNNGRIRGRGYRGALYGAAGLANNPALTSLLLERGADPDDGESMYHAAFHPDHACLRLLVEHGAAVNGTNAMAVLIGQGDVDGVRLLLSAGADPGRPQPAGMAPIGCLADRTLNPLPAAAASDSAAVVEALLDAGADPNAPGRDGRSPVRLATRRGKSDVVAVLLQHGAVDDATDIDRLLGACLLGDRPRAEALVNGQPGLFGQMDDDDRAALVDAAEYASGAAGAVTLMLDLGFPAGARRAEDGATALHAAAYWGRVDVVGLLLERGADINQLDSQWQSTALAWATVGSGEQAGRSGHGEADWVATVEVLLEAGSSTDGAWVESKPPSEDVAGVLLAHGITAGGSSESEESESESDAVLPEGVVEQLRAAFDNSDLELLSSLLDDDVRWGGGPAGCHNRIQVIDWYQALHNQGVHGRVIEAIVEGDAVVLGLVMSRAGGSGATHYQVFKVRDGRVVEIWGHPDREEALASVTHG